jgi:hypothetical protein
VRLTFILLLSPWALDQAIFLFYALWQKINQTNSIFKGLYQNLWRILDTRRWKNSQTSHVFESLLLTAKMFCQLASPAKVLFLISGPTGVVFWATSPSSWYDWEFYCCCCYNVRVYPWYIRGQQVETLRKLGSQAVHRTD